MKVVVYSLYIVEVAVAVIVYSCLMVITCIFHKGRVAFRTIRPTILPQQRQICDERCQGFAVGIAGRGFHGGDDARGDEARKGIDVAIGVIVDESAVEPHHLARTERKAQARVEVGLRSAGVARPTEQALLGGEQCAGAVDFDRASFEMPPTSFITSRDTSTSPGMTYLPPQPSNAKRDAIGLAPGAVRKIGPVSRSQMSPYGMW